jgi:hypothetical protein
VCVSVSVCVCVCVCLTICDLESSCMGGLGCWAVAPKKKNISFFQSVLRVGYHVAYYSENEP